VANTLPLFPRDLNPEQVLSGNAKTLCKPKAGEVAELFTESCKAFFETFAEIHTAFSVVYAVGLPSSVSSAALVSLSFLVTCPEAFSVAE